MWNEIPHTASEVLQIFHYINNLVLKLFFNYFSVLKFPVFHQVQWNEYLVLAGFK